MHFVPKVEQTSVHLFRHFFSRKTTSFSSSLLHFFFPSLLIPQYRNAYLGDHIRRLELMHRVRLSDHDDVVLAIRPERAQLGHARRHRIRARGETHVPVWMDGWMECCVRTDMVF